MIGGRCECETRLHYASSIYHGPGLVRRRGAVGKLKRMGARRFLLCEENRGPILIDTRETVLK